MASSSRSRVVQLKILQIFGTLDYKWELNGEDENLSGHAIELKNLLLNHEDDVLGLLWPSDETYELLQNHRAAVTFLSFIAEKAPERIESKLMVVVPPLVNLIQNADSEVRRKAFIVFQHFCNRFGPMFQKLYHGHVLNILIDKIGDFHSTQIEAVRLLGCFIEGSSYCFDPYIGKAVNKLIRCLEVYAPSQDFTQTGKSAILEVVLEGITSICTISEGKMGDHYARVLAHLVSMVRDAEVRNNRRLLASVIVCITKLWTAMGEEMSSNDIGRVMELIVSFDPMLVSFQAWGSICKCLGSRFQQYTELVIPRLLAQLNTNMGVENVEEKAEACKMFGTFAAVLKEEFHVWIPKVVRTLIPLMSSYVPRVVRIAAMKAAREGIEQWRQDYPDIAESVQAAAHEVDLVLLESFGRFKLEE